MMTMTMNVLISLCFFHRIFPYIHTNTLVVQDSEVSSGRGDNIPRIKTDLGKKLELRKD